MYTLSCQWSCCQGDWNSDLIWLESAPVMPLYILGLHNSSGDWSGTQLGSPKPHRSLPIMGMMHVYYWADLFWKCSWPRALKLAYRKQIQHLNEKQLLPNRKLGGRISVQTLCCKCWRSEEGFRGKSTGDAEARQQPLEAFSSSLCKKRGILWVPCHSWPSPSHTGSRGRSWWLQSQCLENLHYGPDTWDLILSVHFSFKEHMEAPFIM